MVRVLLLVLLLLAGTALFWLNGSQLQLRHVKHRQTPDVKKALKVVKLWKATPPGEPMNVGPEKDVTKRSDELIANRRVIRMTNVSSPEIHIFSPQGVNRTSTAVVICPGGGFRILAWDLEGTEVACWLNSIGVTAILLKYRVPTYDQTPAWKAPLQDVQRAISFVRSMSSELNIDPKQVGVLGFSAGGVAAMRSCVTKDRSYPSVDEVDRHSCRPDFSILVYSGGVLSDDEQGVRQDLQIDGTTPPAFLIHASDDMVPVQNSLLYRDALQNAGVPVKVHTFETGGHGYGVRRVLDSPVTNWPSLCETWLRQSGIVEVVDP